MTERIAGDGYVKRSFEEWRDIVFRQDPAQVDPWWSSLEGDQWDHPLHVVDYLMQLCSDPLTALEGLTDAQVANGLDYLSNAARGGCWDELYRMRVSTEQAVACVHTIYTLFERVFAARCAPVPLHATEASGHELNSLCYMWWDIISLQSDKGDDRRGSISKAMLDVMRRTLALPNMACQESALHGLGLNNIRAYRDQVGGIIDEYLAANPNLRPELRLYAENARIGHVL
jgi:hypothetical protein